MAGEIKTLIVDDSLIVRQVLRRELGAYPDIEIVGSAPDPYVARDLIVKLKPDVITLDLEMPRMDGITFLRKLMKSYPVPVVVVSGLTPTGCALSMEALELGAVDVIEKPSFSDQADLKDFSLLLYDKVKAAAKAKVGAASASLRRMRSEPRRVAFDVSAPALRNKIIAVGASTGGTEALKDFLQMLPQGCPPVVIVQHMPENFTAAFARRLDESCPNIEVLESKTGMEAIPGRAIIANGGLHMIVRRKSSGGYMIENREGPLVCRHRPSVEVLFNSVAKSAAADAVGVIMTGMGADGANGLLNMRNAGARTIAQDEESCVVFGMPKEAIKLNAAERVVSLDKIVQTVFSFYL